MQRLVGWVLDVYADQRDGVVVWFACEDGTRHRLHQPFPTTFYAAGPFPRLRALWKYLTSLPASIQLERTTGEDLFSGPIDVLAATVRNAFEFQRVFRRVNAAFPELEYYDADIPISIRYAARQEMFPLVLCEVVIDHSGKIHETTPIENRWDIELSTPALRVLTMRPNVDPHHRAPTHIELGFNRETYTLRLRPERALLISLRAMIKRFDPDLIHTYWGDTWMFPHVFELAEKHDFNFNPNRDQTRTPLRRQEGSYFTYGQVVYRGHQVHLFGRWHIDAMNAVMYGEHGYVGVFEQARVSSLPVQTTARRSPGAGIMALQFITALKRGVLIPFHKQEAEKPKSVLGLMRADRGGMVYKPTTGLHENVAQLDFDSMYPSIMVAFNVSPETVLIDSDDADIVPELGISIDQSKRGIVSETLQPLLYKRLEIKKMLLDLSRHDCRRAPLEARSSALKWLLVVSFGYLEY